MIYRKFTLRNVSYTSASKGVTSLYVFYDRVKFYLGGKRVPAFKIREGSFIVLEHGILYFHGSRDCCYGCRGGALRCRKSQSTPHTPSFEVEGEAYGIFDGCIFNR